MDKSSRLNNSHQVSSLNPPYLSMFFHAISYRYYATNSSRDLQVSLVGGRGGIQRKIIPPHLNIVIDSKDRGKLNIKIQN